MKKLFKSYIFFSIISLFISQESNPKVALVLSGGAAKGYAHIPVLEMIDSLDINIDMIVGTSIGANVGSLYSVGYSAKDIYKKAFETNWIAIFLDEANRYDMSYIHKKEASKYQIDFDLKGYYGITPSLPSGVIHGQRAYMELSKILGHYEYIKDFKDLYIPFYCNASDLISGKDILLSKGSLVTAVRSSTSIPSIFSPVEYKDYLLVDGGVTNNVPSNIAKDLGADIIFTVKVSSSKPSKERLKSSVVDILGESVFMHTSELTEQNMNLSDYAISVKIPDGSGANFTPNGLKNIYTTGKKQVYENIDLFLELKNRVGPQKKRARLKKINELDLIVKDIKISGNETFNDGFIKNNLNISKNDTLSLSLINNGINNLYGLGHFDIIRYELKPDQELKTVNLNIFTEESKFNKLQTGLRWDHYHELIAAINIRLKDIISPNLLIKNEIQFPGILKNTFEISYPLTLFNNPYYPFYRNIYHKRDVNGYSLLGEKIITYDTRTIENNIGAGIVFGKNLAIEISHNYHTANLEVEVGNNQENSIDEYKNQITRSSSLMLDYDSRDDAQLTKKGSLINLKLFQHHKSPDGLKALFFDFDLYQSIGRNVFRIHGLAREIYDQDTFNSYIFFQGRADRAVGYAPYILSSNKLEMAGLEWRYNYKSYYIRLFYSEIFSLNQTHNNFNLDEKLSSYGYGFTFNSPFGLLELIVGKAPKTLSASSKKTTTFKVNLGYKF
tara:strand:+ start:38 stop:2221 length:2184 start_codon:yes stop_codon:yes gene_type:complete